MTPAQNTSAYIQGFEDGKRTAKAEFAKLLVAQPEQEPFDGCVMVGHSKEHGAYFVYEETAPQEFCAIKGPFATRSEAEKAMRDPNAPLIQQPKEPEQEPVAWQVEFLIQGVWSPIGNPQRDKDRAESLAANPAIPKECQRIIELYTTSPQRKPLTDRQIWDAYMKAPVDIDCHISDLHKFARAIEAAHGIKEKNT